MEKTLSVILPAYNEAQSLPALVEQIRACIGQEQEIIVVDDASSDQTRQVAESLGVRVISHPYNMGNGAAVKSGIRAARGEYVVLMDADGQHDPAQLEQLLQVTEHFPLVIGARTAASPQVWYRKLANGMYNMLASYVVGIRIQDLTSGFRVMKRDIVTKFLYLLPNTFSYPTTITLSFIKAGYPVRFVPITVAARRKGKSKINLFADGTRFFLIIVRIATFFAPLKVFIPLSLLLFVCGLSYYLYTFVTAHRFTNMSALLFSTSVIIFMLGLVSEQIAALRMEKVKE